MKKLCLSLVLASIGSLALTNSAMADDVNEIYNPNPQKDDVVLSMPCDGIMVFRKVYTSNDPKKIKDKKYNAGTAQNESPMGQNPNKRYVQGSFYDKNGYYFLMSKYELMKGQYDALTGSSKCKAPNKMARLPAVKVSYFDFINAANAYSIYLQKAKDVPTVDGQKAYVRLPSDEEWEYAARGGTKVTQSEFEALRPPMENDDISLYAWYQGANSANGKIQLTGLKKPNPLGLYDMLGNAQEMTLEPFKAVRTGRLLGLSGGICVRGGSYLSKESALTSALRTEKPLYVNGKPLSAPDTGTRFVLGLPVATSVKEVKNLNEEILSLSDDDSDDNALSGEADKIAKLDAENKKNKEVFKKEQEKLKSANDELSAQNSSLEQKTEKLKNINSDLMALNDKLAKSNDDLNGQLGSLKEKIVKANDERESMRDVAITANLRLGGFLCKSIADETSSVQYFESIRKLAKMRCDENQERCKFYEKINNNYIRHKQALHSIITYYGDTMANASANYNLKDFKSQLASSKEAFGAETSYDEFVDKYYSHLMSYKNLSKDRDKNQKMWSEQCQSIGTK